MAGGMTHLDTFDHKPKLAEMHGKPMPESLTKGQQLGELAQARDIKAKADETQHTIRRAQIKYEIAQLTLDQLKSQGRSADEIKIQELQVELAKMDLDETLTSLGIDPNISVTTGIDTQIAQARVFAPADGTIIAAVNVGRNVSPTTPAFVIGDPNKLEVIADLDASKGDNEVKQMFEGMSVVVTLDSKADVKWTGTIRQLPSPYGTGASDDRSVHIVLDASSDASKYQAGDKVSVIVQLASHQKILWLPPEAIRSVGGRTFVIITSDSGISANHENRCNWSSRSLG
jgi:multidrug efflux pump subunit AcrA (membrane-fusion protein)